MKLPVEMLLGVTVNPFVIVAVLPVVSTVEDVAGNVIVVLSVPANVSVLDTVKVFDVVPLAIEKPVARAVNVVAAVPENVTLPARANVPVVNVGELAPPESTTCPAVPAAVYACAVPVPYPMPPAVAVAVELVPPFAIGRTPLTPAVSET